MVSSLLLYASLPDQIWYLANKRLIGVAAAGAAGLTLAVAFGALVLQLQLNCSRSINSPITVLVYFPAVLGFGRSKQAVPRP